MHIRNRQWIALVMVTNLAASWAGAQPRQDLTQPATAEASTASQQAQTLGGKSLPDRQSPGFSTEDLRAWVQPLGAMAVVIAMIFLARRVLNKLSAHTHRGGPAKAVTVLSRTTIAPRQQILLVKMGSRLAFIGSGPQGPVMLREVSEPAEVSMLAADSQGSAISKEASS